jgi:hypothetical protein
LPSPIDALPQTKRVIITAPLGEPVLVDAVLSAQADANGGTSPDRNVGAGAQTKGHIALNIDAVTPGITYTTASTHDYRSCPSKCVFQQNQALFDKASDVLTTIADKVNPAGAWLTRWADQKIDDVFKNTGILNDTTVELAKEAVHRGIDDVVKQSEKIAGTVVPELKPIFATQEVASKLSEGVKVLAAIHRILGNDPFDPNFATMASPALGLLANSPSALIGVSPQFLAAFRGVEFRGDLYLGYSIALAITMNRYQSAIQVGDGRAVQLQLTALNNYLQCYLDAQKHLGNALTMFISELRSEQLDVAFDGNAFATLQGQVRATGLPADVLAALQSAGDSDSDISALVASFLAIDPDLIPSGTLAESLDPVAANFLEDGVANTPDVIPEPATLLLFGTTMIGLGLCRRRRSRQQ